jgi:hypothetical protein
MKQKLLPILVLILVIIFVGSLTAVYISRRNAKKNTPLPSSLTTENRVVNLIKNVSEKYSEKNPIVVRADKDKAEGETLSMYVVTVEGSFQRDGQKANTMTFSMLEDGTNIWALRAYNSNNPDGTVWQDDVVRL